MCSYRDRDRAGGEIKSVLKGQGKENGFKLISKCHVSKYSLHRERKSAYRSENILNM